MSSNRINTWQGIHALMCKKIHDQTWTPGQLIPGEVELARQFGCARTTVNRAMRELAVAGLVDRKRKAGTRVASLRARKVTAVIPIIKSQVEASGRHYRFELKKKQRVTVPGRVASKMGLGVAATVLFTRTVHYADNSPFSYEERWINIETVPAILSVDLNEVSVNEWLVRHVPFSEGQIQVTALNASETVARILQIDQGVAVLHNERQTWLEGRSVTLAGVFHAPGYGMTFDL